MKLSAALGLALPLVLSLSALTPVLGERTAQQIVSDANKLLSEGSYVQAARAYGEAIGESATTPGSPCSLLVLLSPDHHVGSPTDRVRARPVIICKLLQASDGVSLAGE